MRLLPIITAYEICIIVHVQSTYVEYVHTLSVLIQNTCMYNEYIIYIMKIRFMVIRRIK